MRDATDLVKVWLDGSLASVVTTAAASVVTRTSRVYGPCLAAGAVGRLWCVARWSVCFRRPDARDRLSSRRNLPKQRDYRVSVHVTPGVIHPALLPGAGCVNCQDFIRFRQQAPSDQEIEPRKIFSARGGGGGAMTDQMIKGKVLRKEECDVVVHHGDFMTLSEALKAEDWVKAKALTDPSTGEFGKLVTRAALHFKEQGGKAGKTARLQQASTGPQRICRQCERCRSRLRQSLCVCVAAGCHCGRCLPTRQRCEYHHVIVRIPALQIPTLHSLPSLQPSRTCSASSACGCDHTFVIVQRVYVAVALVRATAMGYRAFCALLAARTHMSLSCV